MQSNFLKRLVFLSLWVFTCVAHAETLYVTDTLNIGLHKDQSIDSPITQIIPSGTAMSVIERVDDLIHVQVPGGIQGWINSKYAVTEKTGRNRIIELEAETKKLQKEIEVLQSKNDAVNTATTVNNASDEQQKALEQQLNSERLKVGELQAQLTDLRSRIANIDNPDSLLAEIEQLQEENKTLISQLETSGGDVSNKPVNDNYAFNGNDWKKLLGICLLVLIFGMLVGAYLLDYINRRRHGGFRV